MKLLLELRNAAKIERDSLTAFNMRKAADELDIAMREFKDTSTGAALTTLNGCWSRGLRMLGRASPAPDHPGGRTLSEMVA